MAAFIAAGNVNSSVMTGSYWNAEAYSQRPSCTRILVQFAKALLRSSGFGCRDGITCFDLNSRTVTYATITSISQCLPGSTAKRLNLSIWTSILSCGPMGEFQHWIWKNLSGIKSDLVIQATSLVLRFRHLMRSSRNPQDTFIEKRVRHPQLNGLDPKRITAHDDACARRNGYALIYRKVVIVNSGGVLSLVRNPEIPRPVRTDRQMTAADLDITR